MLTEKVMPQKWTLDYVFIPYGRLFIGNGQGKPGSLSQALYSLEEQEQLVYPASSFKGKLRANFKRILLQLNVRTCNDCNDVTAEPCPVCKLFGSVRRAGMLHFSNLSYTDVTKEEVTGVTIDRRRGVASEKKLYNYEYFRASQLKGQIWCYQKNGQDQDLDHYLVLALLTLDNLGGKNSTGLGKGHFIVEVNGKSVGDWDEYFALK